MSKCIEWLFHILQVLVSPPTSPPPLFQAVVTVCFSRAHSRPKRAPHSLSFVYMLCSHNVKHLKSSLLHTPATIRRRALFHLSKKKNNENLKSAFARPSLKCIITWLGWRAHKGDNFRATIPCAALPTYIHPPHSHTNLDLPRVAQYSVESDMS